MFTKPSNKTVSLSLWPAIFAFLKNVYWIFAFSADTRRWILASSAIPLGIQLSHYPDSMIIRLIKPTKPHWVLVVCRMHFGRSKVACERPDDWILFVARVRTRTNPYGLLPKLLHLGCCLPLFLPFFFGFSSPIILSVCDQVKEDRDESYSTIRTACRLRISIWNLSLN